ncbi:MAG: ABC transporter permease subunit [Oscillospiraceae bacterium]|jgi:NitT/TauT family transport system permease protein|nr:ABC transporter permease subunit [Oscillospiraceae bacterium]
MNAKEKGQIGGFVRGVFLRVPHGLFLIFLLVQLLPNQTAKPDAPIYAVVLSAALEAALIAALAVSRRGGSRLFADIVCVIYAALIVWTLATAKLNIIRETLFPPPGVVLRQLITDVPQLFGHIAGSLSLVALGYFLALAFSIPAGLFLGYNARLGNAASYVAKFLGAIPPVVYIPYGIALLPSFRSVSVMVIFLASFWPVLGGTMSGVMYVEKRIVDSARALNVRGFTMLFRVLLNAALPQILIGCSQGLTVSFILLTSAEMIGARRGMGYYVKNYSDLGNYTRTIVGVLVIGVVISLVFFAFNRLQKFLLRWKT